MTTVPVNQLKIVFNYAHWPISDQRVKLIILHNLYILMVQ